MYFSVLAELVRELRPRAPKNVEKIFVDLTKFQRIFNENFNESAKISTNSTKISTDQRKFRKINENFIR